ncbi:hypothetical protein A4X09_0g4427 [Tilletia walkeri]|uniref:DDE Tnp4 domain-containing protein n=1 Tax=Tilletia walkeri TaxID=117179 RepID=A0A8X7N8V5_9BASI|nr:hypothetical protein A4X09_0g4427 [Tilletia walkeri]
MLVHGLYSVVEWTFGVMQARFKVLKTGIEYETKVQAALFPALAVVHNFLRRHDPNDIPAAVEEVPAEEELDIAAADRRSKGWRHGQAV